MRLVSRRARNNAAQPAEDIYIPEVDLEDFEDYAATGYHPVVIGKTLCDGCYHVTPKLGFCGYPTTWLAGEHRIQAMSL
ncbi:hypothetical protein NKR23_g1376 [Pleurostoma richardsiae]|uniref:Uncharacterized protein n=1 Tax=Pleurostoma richardsiae TaxID=41990 RepID=A0AA38VPG3_9PEZI|nr:hypothetical protein NKR23_g1376 [Pleurostoma richardsiae]